MSTPGESLMFGPVEMHVISCAGGQPSPAILAALVERVDRGDVRLLDFVLLSKTEPGNVVIDEVDLDEYSLADLTIHMPGLAAQEDLLELGGTLPLGGVAAVVVFELLWARELSERLALAGSAVVRTIRVPAATVNAVVGAALGPW